MSTNSIRVDAARFWQSLIDLARIGATPKVGVRRLASPIWIDRDAISSWAGCATRARSSRSTAQATSLPFGGAAMVVPRMWHLYREAKGIL